MDHPSHPARYRKELRTEIKKMRKKFARRVRNDTVGNPDFSQEYPVTNTRAWKAGQEDPEFTLLKRREREKARKNNVMKAANEAYKKTGDMGDFIAIALGVKKV